ncbi:MAG: NUDIX hydrolase, partial [Actinomycetales bacterium]|nr:NUDIX hydrolase [Actinomycetales bacterium]
MTTHPQLTGNVVDAIGNLSGSWPVVGSEVGFANDYLKVTVDTISDPAGVGHSRVVVRPRGAVGVAALDSENRILLVQQFRHAVQKQTVEIPAGILDVAGESKVDAAARELAEEADVVAASWQHLLTINPTPGFCSEEIDLFLARDLSPVALADRIEREAEEAHMSQWWVPLDKAVESVLAGKITDAKTISAILAVAA